LISSVYKWGTADGLISVPNPVQDIYRPKKQQTCGRDLSLAELSAIWRACESLATSPMSYRGNGNGLPTPVPANSIRAGGILLTSIEAARQFGYHKAIVWRAIKAGDLKALLRGDVPIGHPANHPRKIKQGQGHRKDYLIEASEMERFANSRLVLMRSPLAEYTAVVRLLMLMGGRWSEIGALRKSELDLDKGILHIKGERAEGRRGTKNKRDLRLPLPPMAIAILKDIPQRPSRDFLFGIGPKGLLDNGIFKERLDARIAEIEGQPIKAWRHHDLRHSLSTHMNEMGIDERVIETIVNHWSGHRSRSIGYNHAKYWEKMKKAIEWWARTVRNVADGVEPDTNVTHVDFGKQQTAIGEYDEKGETRGSGANKSGYRHLVQGLD
jgi:integrase